MSEKPLSLDELTHEEGFVLVANDLDKQLSPEQEELLDNLLY